MPRYHRLETDVSTTPWDLLETRDLGRALGLPVDAPPDPNRTLAEHFSPQIAPEAIAQPLRVQVEGRSPASFITRSRGFWRESTTDLIVSPALAALLAGARLPRHAKVRCDVYAYPADSWGVLPKGRKPKGPFPFQWLWWQEYFKERLDPSRSRFELRYRDGSRTETSYESLEDLEQIQKRAVNMAEFSIRPLLLEWLDPVIDELDLIPMGASDVYLSERLAERVRNAGLPAIEVLPPPDLPSPAA